MPGVRARILLTHKIATLGAIGIIGVLLLGAIYHVGSSTQEHYLQIAERARAMLAKANAVENKLLEARRAEKDFLLRGDLTYVERHTAADSAVRADIEALRQQAAAADLKDLGRQIDSIAGGLAKYRTHFRALAEARQKLGLDVLDLESVAAVLKHVLPKSDDLLRIRLRA